MILKVPLTSESSKVGSHQMPMDGRAFSDVVQNKGTFKKKASKSTAAKVRHVLCSFCGFECVRQDEGRAISSQILIIVEFSAGVGVPILETRSGTPFHASFVQRTHVVSHNSPKFEAKPDNNRNPSEKTQTGKRHDVTRSIAATILPANVRSRLK